MIGMLRQELLAELYGMLVRPYRAHLNRERLTQLLHLLIISSKSELDEINSPFSSH